jgi:hypothetical protein
MIADRSDIQVQGNIEGNKIGMKFDENSLVHLMSVLTDLYSDQELAIIREYSTNALDSHVEAGQTRPIEVTTPTSLSPFFKVKDYGVGMDEAGIINTYSKYGASTKRETNEQVGVLGLGCKSALTYTSQFTLVGIKDGVRTMVSIGRDEDGAGSMTILEQSLTVEENGVEIIIPAKSYNEISRKAQHFFSFWKPGTVLLNGEEPAYAEGFSVSDSLLIQKNVNLHTRKHIVVMGGVPYPVNEDDLNLPTLSKSYSVVAYVNIGDVNFTPSRETLQYTKKTKATLERVALEVEAGLIDAAQKDIDSAASSIEAFRKSVDWRNIIVNTKVNFTYQKSDIPEQIDAPTGERIVVAPANSYKLNSSSRYPALNAETFVDGLLVHGYDHDSFTPTHKKKLLQYSVENALAPSNYILTNTPLNVSWIDSNLMVDWGLIKAIKLETTIHTRNNRLRGSYNAVVKGSYKYDVMAADIDTSEDLFWYTKETDSNVTAYVRVNYPDSTLVELALNRISKFQRDFPSAIKVTDAVIQAYKDTADLLTEEEKQVYGLKRSEHQWALNSLRELSYAPIEDYIEDPAVVEGIKLATYELPKDVVTKLDDLNKVLRYERGHNVIQYSEWVNPLEKYPLINTNHLTHTLIYINASYLAEQETI